MRNCIDSGGSPGVIENIIQRLTALEQQVLNLLSRMTEAENNIQALWEAIVGSGSPSGRSYITVTDRVPAAGTAFAVIPWLTSTIIEYAMFAAEDYVTGTIIIDYFNSAGEQIGNWRFAGEGNATDPFEVNIPVEEGTYIILTVEGIAEGTTLGLTLSFRG